MNANILIIMNSDGRSLAQQNKQEIMNPLVLMADVASTLSQNEHKGLFVWTQLAELVPVQRSCMHYFIPRFFVKILICSWEEGMAQFPRSWSFQQGSLWVNLNE